MEHPDNLRYRCSELDYLLGSDSEVSEGEDANEVEDVIVHSSRKRLLAMELDCDDKEGMPTNNSQLFESNDLSDSDNIIPASDDELNGPSRFCFLRPNKNKPSVCNDVERPEPNPTIVEISPTLHFDSCRLFASSSGEIPSRPIPTKIKIARPINITAPTLPKKRRIENKRGRPVIVPSVASSTSVGSRPTIRPVPGPVKRKGLNDAGTSSTHPKKKQKFCDADWPWLDAQNEPHKIDFCGTPQINSRALRSQGENPSELDCVMQFLGNEFWNMVCIETNDYAKKTIQTPGRKQLKSDQKWTDVSIDELKAYFALYVNMAQVKKPELKQYWSNRKIIETPMYSNTMPYERFSLISRFLHFYDESVETSEGDKLKKIRPVIRYLETKFLHMME